jgi:hypothetical protein
MNDFRIVALFQLLNELLNVERPGMKLLVLIEGRATAQAVSRRLPTAAVRVQFQVRSCGICGGQSGTGAGFLRVLRFPLPILIPPTAPHSPIVRGWYNMPNSGRRNKWTQSHPTPKKFTKKRPLMEHDSTLDINQHVYSDWLWVGRLRGRSSSAGRGKTFVLSTSRPDLGPTQPPIQWVPGALSPGVKRPGREDDHSPPTSAEVKNTWIYTSTPPYVFMA